MTEDECDLRELAPTTTFNRVLSDFTLVRICTRDHPSLRDPTTSAAPSKLFPSRPGRPHGLSPPFSLNRPLSLNRPCGLHSGSDLAR